MRQGWPVRLARATALWLPVVLWMAFIFLMSNQSGLPTPKSSLLDLLIKKTAHVLEYGILGLLLYRGCTGSLRGHGLLPLVIAVAIGVLYAFSDEYHQLFVPTRKGNARDVVIDTVAVILAVALAWQWQRRPKEKEQEQVPK